MTPLQAESGRERQGPLEPPVVSGRGAVSAFGLGRIALRDGIFGGASGIRPRERTSAFDVPTAVAGELPLSTWRELGGNRDLAFRCALAAAREALQEAGSPDPREIALVLASTKGDLGGLLDAGDGFGLTARLAARVAAALELGGSLGAVSCACASGLLAIATGLRTIRAGAWDRVLVVGVDVLHEFVLAGFGSLHALDPDRCKPFDARRRGVSLGDGAAALLISAHPDESCGVALLGAGGANDARHLIHPDPEGEGVTLAVQRAFASARVAPGDIDLVHLHGTGTPANDAGEAAGLARAFGGSTPPAFGTKAQTGHTLGASGVLETLIAIEALQCSTVPPNLELSASDVDGRLDLVRAVRHVPGARTALKVSSGFGGLQAALVLRA